MGNDPGLVLSNPQHTWAHLPYKENMNLEVTVYIVPYYLWWHPISQAAIVPLQRRHSTSIHLWAYQVGSGPMAPVLPMNYRDATSGDGSMSPYKLGTTDYKSHTPSYKLIIFIIYFVFSYRIYQSNLATTVNSETPTIVCYMWAECYQPSVHYLIKNLSYLEWYLPVGP